MGWGFYAPCIVYGFREKDGDRIIDYDFLGKYDLERYALYTNKGMCYGFVYGKSCPSLETMDTIDKSLVDTAFANASKYGEYVAPTYILALHGNIVISGYIEYNPESSS
jgi:hypothetical protein